MSTPSSALPPFPPCLTPSHTPMFDAHTHLASLAEFPDELLDSIVVEAQAACVRQVVVVSESVAQAHRVLEICRRYPSFMLPSAGIHPVTYSLLADGTSARAEELNSFTSFLEAHHEELVCMGEIGLDYSPWILQQAAEISGRQGSRDAAASPSDSFSSSSSPSTPSAWKSRLDPSLDALERQAQLDLFRHQVHLALRYHLPLNIHSRNASAHAVQLLKDEGVLRGGAESNGPAVPVLLHAFDGSMRTMREALRLGCFISATSSLGRDAQMQRVLAQVLIEGELVGAEVSQGEDGGTKTVQVPAVLLQMVLETDSPALHPIKQPPPSSTSAAASSSSSSSCCPAENNTPKNLYVALLVLYDLYCSSMRTRDEQDRVRAINAARKLERKKKMMEAERAAKEGTATETNNGAAPAAHSAPPPPLPSPSPVLTLPELASLLLFNSYRLFPCAARSLSASFPAST